MLYLQIEKLKNQIVLHKNSMSKHAEGYKNVYENRICTTHNKRIIVLKKYLVWGRLNNFLDQFEKEWLKYE